MRQIQRCFGLALSTMFRVQQECGKLWQCPVKGGKAVWHQQREKLLHYCLHQMRSLNYADQKEVLVCSYSVSGVSSVISVILCSIRSHDVSTLLWCIKKQPNISICRLLNILLICSSFPVLTHMEKF